MSRIPSQQTYTAPLTFVEPRDEFSITFVEVAAARLNESCECTGCHSLFEQLGVLIKESLIL
jgi:hypothetical protein